MILNLWEKIRSKIGNRNYLENKKLEHPNGYLYGQASLRGDRFGLTTMDKVGCGIVAAYNALKLLGQPTPIAELILEFETNGTETIPFGFFGINPYSLQKFFFAHHISFYVLTSENAEKCREEGAVYIFTFWLNAKNPFKGAHHVAAQYREGKYEVYNRYNNSTDVSRADSVAKIIGKGRFIRGYSLISIDENGE